MIQPHLPQFASIYGPLFFRGNLLLLFLPLDTPIVGPGYDVSKQPWVMMLATVHISV